LSWSAASKLAASIPCELIAMVLVLNFLMPMMTSASVSGYCFEERWRRVPAAAVRHVEVAWLQVTEPSRRRSLILRVKPAVVEPLRSLRTYWVISQRPDVIRGLTNSLPRGGGFPPFFRRDCSLIWLFRRPLHGDIPITVSRILPPPETTLAAARRISTRRDPSNGLSPREEYPVEPMTGASIRRRRLSSFLVRLNYGEKLAGPFAQ